MFSVHTTTEEFKNGAITGLLGYVWTEGLTVEIKRLGFQILSA